MDMVLKRNVNMLEKVQTTTGKEAKHLQTFYLSKHWNSPSVKVRLKSDFNQI